MRLPFIYITLLVFLTACQNDTEKIKPTLTPMSESVYASVTVQPEDLYAVYATMPGIIDEVFIEEGDVVKQGQNLAQIINTVSQINADNAQLSLQLAQENLRGQTNILNGIEDEIRAARIKLSSDSLNYFRQKRLWEQNVGAKIDLDNRALAYELSTNNLAALQNKLARTKRELATQVKQSKNVVKSSKVNEKDYAITAKIDGKVYAIFKNAGELISLQEPLASIGNNNLFVIEMLVDEVDIAKINLGQKTLITLDAYGETVFTGKITKIYPRKEERTQTFKVEATFNNSPDKLFPGLSGEANIILTEKPAVLTIPIEYLMPDNKVKTEKGEQKVTIGMKNLERVEILSGIDTSTYLLNPLQ